MSSPKVTITEDKNINQHIELTSQRKYNQMNKIFDMTPKIVKDIINIINHNRRDLIKLITLKYGLDSVIVVDGLSAMKLSICYERLRKRILTKQQKELEILQDKWILNTQKSGDVITIIVNPC